MAVFPHRVDDRPARRAAQYVGEVRFASLEDARHGVLLRHISDPYRKVVMAQQKIFGYVDRLSVRPGEEIAFHVNADGTNEAKAQLVRLIHGDSHPAGPGYIEEEIDSRSTAPGR